MEDGTSYLLRVWLPDRPGALGQVAARIGALKGDVISVEIVERDGRRAIDELVVSFPTDISEESIVNEIHADEEVEVEYVHPVDSLTHDPQFDFLQAAAVVVAAESASALFDALVDEVRQAVPWSWACVIDESGILASSGDCPEQIWLTAFIAGSPDGNGWGGPLSASEATWFAIAAASAKLVVGGQQVLRAKERGRLAALARIADIWSRRLTQQSSRRG